MCPLSAAGVEPAYAPISPEPDAAGTVFQDTVDVIVGDAFGYIAGIAPVLGNKAVSIMCKYPVSICAYPDDVAIWQHVVNIVGYNVVRDVVLA